MSLFFGFMSLSIWIFRSAIVPLSCSLMYILMFLKVVPAAVSSSFSVF